MADTDDQHPVFADEQWSAMRTTPEVGPTLRPHLQRAAFLVGIVLVSVTAAVAALLILGLLVWAATAVWDAALT